MVADKQFDQVLAKLGDDLSPEQYEAIEDCLSRGMSVKDTVKAVRKM